MTLEYDENGQPNAMSWETCQRLRLLEQAIRDQEAGAWVLYVNDIGCSVWIVATPPRPRLLARAAVELTEHGGARIVSFERVEV